MGKQRVLAAWCACIAGLAVVVPAPAAAARDRAPGRPVGLRVDDVAAPLGIEGTPSFAWRVVDPDPNEIQRAYEILVARQPTSDPADASVVWDSGRVASAEQSYVEYAGPSLPPDTTWYWTVRTWDRHGAAGPFARPARFDTSLRDADWQAQWIRRGSFTPGDKEDFSYARKEVTLRAEPITRAVAYVSASHQYELRINGRRADRGQAFAYPDAQYYRSVDVSALLRPGAPNVFGMLSHWYGAGQGRPAAAPGLILQVSIEHHDGSRELVTTDGTWRVHEAEWQPAPPRNDEGDFVERIDGRLHPRGWDRTGFDDSSWEPATVVGRHPVAPWTHLVAQPTGIVEHVVHPVSVKKVRSAYVADFGRVYAARPSVHFVHGREGRSIALRAGYLLERDGRVSAKHGIQATDMSYGYVQRDGAQTFVPFGYLGFRYLEVDDPGESLDRDAIVAFARHARVPDDHAATFESSDHRLERVWELARHSALYGSQEQFVDTPTREKGQFLADAFNVSLADMRAFGERTLTQQALGQFAASQARYWPDGPVSAASPTGNPPSDIPDYTERFPLWVWAYYVDTGDRRRLGELYPVLVNVSDYVARAVSPSTGLVTKLPGGEPDYPNGIVDYPLPMRYGYDMRTTARTTVNVLAVEVFRTVRRIAEVLERPRAELDVQRRRERALTDAINDRLTRRDGVYVDGLLATGAASEHASQHANAYALAAGIVPKARVENVGRYVARLGMQMGPMNVAALLQALHVTGHDRELVRLLTNPRQPGWAQILAKGGTFTWESWTPSDALGDSMSHAWGAVVLPAMQGALLGVRPLEAGYAFFEVRPPAALHDAAGRVPTDRGPIRVSWQRDEGRIRLRVRVPVNAAALVRLPGRRPVMVGSGEHRFPG